MSGKMRITLPEKKSKQNPLFSKLSVGETMRHQIISLGKSQTIAAAIRTFIKNKVDGVLVEDNSGLPAGVVTKTEITGAYYAGLPLDMQLEDIIAVPVIHCSSDDTLESALVTMQQAEIHRIFITDQTGKAIGTLSYPDIVGTLYKFCCDCEYSLRKKIATHEETRLRYSIKEVMHQEVISAFQQDTIVEVIEKISSYRLGALLITNSTQKPIGVISKTDLTLAYGRGIGSDNSAETIMHGPVKLCHCDLPLEEGIRQMVFAEISRLFVYSENENTVTGVLSLSDAARIRSGSCQACSSSRIKVKE